MQTNLPLNWCECKLGDVFHTSSGGTPSRRETAYYGGDIPWLKSGELNDGIISEAEEFITKEGLENSSAKIFPKGSILLALYGATVGKIGVLDFDSATNQAVCCIYSNPYFNKNLLFYYLLSQRKHLINQGKGGAQPNISQDIVKNLVLPLPPLAEQERIVAKIEALFQDIDEGVERLKSAQAQIKQYRQSVLKSAFEGKLYKTTDWKEVKLSKIADALGGYAFKSEKFSDVGYQIIRMGNIKPLTLNLEEKSVYIKDIDDKIKDKYLLQPNDIVITLTGTRKKRDYGYVVLIKDNSNLLLNQRLARLRPNDKVNAEYLAYALQSEPYQTQFFLYETGNVGQGNVSMKALTDESILLPTLPEQRRIVTEIEKRFAVADELEKAVNEGLEKADKLKQSILKKAFEGKLVAQNPNDESASVLLERIKKEQKPTKGKKK